MNKEDKITVIKGVGEKTATTLSKLNIYTVGDLLMHYPSGYETYGDIVKIESLQEGDECIIEAKLVKMPKTVHIKGKSVTSCFVTDSSGQLELTWFNMPFIRNNLYLGTRYLFRGKVGLKNNRRVIRQPKILDRNEYMKNKNVLMPIYPLTAGITNNAIKKAMKAALSEVEIEEIYPKEFVKKHKLGDLKKCLKAVHFPKSEEEFLEARKRLVFDEFYQFMSGIYKLKKEKNSIKSDFIFENTKVSDEIISEFEFELTEGQKKAISDIRADFKSGRVMSRLIQGDVGCGKTAVAIAAMAEVIENGAQAALMVPTQVLAKQHFDDISRVLSSKGYKTVLLDGSMRVKEKREAYRAIEEGEADAIIGTHALIQEGVSFKRLGLCITDEQHRFGVRQRKELNLKGEKPHVLVMSATPIPRTLSLMLYGDLDISVIKQMPSNRKPIKNCVVNTSYRPSAYSFMEKEIKAGHQVYVICAMVEESENIEAENCIDYTETLRERFGMGIIVECVHGKMKTAEKDEILERFAEGLIDILVSTTVVEVGINVPNATVMLIENAERFGLATLHQLRGRIGRGDAQGYCIFMTPIRDAERVERLKTLNSSNDGFFIANEDLRQRGPGDVLGVRQSGEMQFKLADIYNDAEILKEVNLSIQENINSL